MDDATNKDQRIKERAYEIWERAGQPDGQHEAHWTEAERQLQDERGGDLAPMPGGGPAADETEQGGGGSKG